MKDNKLSSYVNEIFHLWTKVLNEILNKCKTNGDRRGLWYINKDETPSSGEKKIVKGKEKTPNLVASLILWSLCTHCKKTRHT